MKLDTFTRAYIDAALWPTTGPKFGVCPCCEQPNKLLNRWPEDEFKQEAMCSGSECGTREMHHEPHLDENYSLADFAPETLQRMIEDCAKFQAEQAANLVDYPTENAGHDFWLTREGHGAGFWEVDFGTEEQCNALTDASEAFGGFYLYPGDDGKLYGN